MADKESRGARLSPDWVLGEIGLHYAVTKGLNEADAHHEAEKFKSYWLAAHGPNAIKRDWLQCWQFWVLNSLSKYGIRPTAPVARPGGSVVASPFAKSGLSWDEYKKRYDDTK